MSCESLAGLLGEIMVGQGGMAAAAAVVMSSELTHKAK